MHLDIENCQPAVGGHKTKFGHVRFHIGGGKTVLAHRLAWQKKFGPIPAGLFVCHKCDNPPCCNLGIELYGHIIADAAGWGPPEAADYAQRCLNLIGEMR